MAQPRKSFRPLVRKDGQTNPAASRPTAWRSIAMCDAVFTLGTAAFLLDDTALRAARGARDPAPGSSIPRRA